MQKRINDNLEIIQDIPKEILEFFHSIYNEAFSLTIVDGKKDVKDPDYKPADHLSLFQHVASVFQHRQDELSDLYSVLKTSFLLGVQDSIKNRQFTMGMTSFIEDFTVFMMYVIIWLNTQYMESMFLDLKLESRRKSAESELTKILSKSWEFCNINDEDLLFVQTPVVRDRFGLRIIFEKNDPELLLKVTKIIVQILVNPESEYAKNFKLWINTCQDKFGGIAIPKDKINNILSFSFYADHIKDYINNRKDNSDYQSWQCTIHINGTSPILGGFMFELQSQTWDMYVHNEDEEGPASHLQHKLRATHGALEAFKLDNYMSGMIFYKGREFPRLDKDGISVPAVVLSRHVSPHVI